MHHDKKQWGENHDDFIPERFDPTSKHYKTPDGKNRHPFSFIPFFGGHRICLGKTFAEFIAKRTISMVLKFYTLEYCDPKYKVERFRYDIAQMRLPIVHFTFNKRRNTTSE